MANVKIDIHNPNADVESRLKYIQDWAIPSSVKKELKTFLDDLGRGAVNKGVQIGKRTQVKYISLLRSPLVYFNKPTEKLTKKDITEYDKVLSQDVLKSEKRKPFSHAMKKDIRVALRVFLRWKLGETKGNEYTEFFDTREVKKTPDYLKETEINLLYKACKTNEERFILAVLFDSGARAEEFCNLRIEDIHLPSGNESFPKLTLKEEYSKTKGRVISLYWANSLEAVSDFVKQRIQEGVKNNEPIVATPYDAIRFFIRRLGERVLNRPLHLHLFRHSSATFYATKLNRQELCYRYGWAFSSDMPDVYISRSGMLNKDLDEKIENTSIGEIKARLAKEEYERKKLAEEKETLALEVTELKERMKQIAELQTQDAVNLEKMQEGFSEMNRIIEILTNLEKGIKPSKAEMERVLKSKSLTPSSKLNK